MKDLLLLLFLMFGIGLIGVTFVIVGLVWWWWWLVVTGAICIATELWFWNGLYHMDNEYEGIYK